MVDPEEAAREALRARVLAVAGGADVRFEQMECTGILGPRLFHRVWVGQMGNGSRAFNGDTLAEAVEWAVFCPTPDDPLPW